MTMFTRRCIDVLVNIRGINGSDYCVRFWAHGPIEVRTRSYVSASVRACEYERWVRCSSPMIERWAIEEAFRPKVLAASEVAS